MSSEVEDETSDRVWKDEVADAAARVVQAVGRLHRHPESGTLVYLLDEAFLEKQWCDEWPAHWKVIAQPHFLDE
jgi:Rad3-related DNA helicase